MNKNHTDDKIMTRLNSENLCHNSGDYLPPSQTQPKNPKTLKETKRITLTPTVVFVCGNLVCITEREEHSFKMFKDKFLKRREY
jgi:hypothetical protein